MRQGTTSNNTELPNNRSPITRYVNHDEWRMHVVRMSPEHFGDKACIYLLQNEAFLQYISLSAENKYIKLLI